MKPIHRKIKGKIRRNMKQRQTIVTKEENLEWDAKGMNEMDMERGRNEAKRDLKETKKRFVRGKKNTKKGFKSTKTVPSSSSTKEFPDGVGGASCTQKRARSRTCFVWDMVCEVGTETKCAICGKCIRSACATNITAHMARKHPKQLTAGKMAAETEKGRPVSFFQQTTPVTPRLYVRPLPTELDVSQREVTKLLSLVIATSNAPIKFVDNALFKEYSLHIPNFKSPNAKALTNAIKAEYSALVDRIKRTLATVDAVAVSVNIATPRIDEPNCSFLLVVADFFNPESWTLAHCLLDVMELQKEYTSDYLKECVHTILEAYAIEHKVFRFTGTNGTNIGAVLAEPFSYSLDEHSDEDSVDLACLSCEQALQVVVTPKDGDAQMLTATEEKAPNKCIAQQLDSTEFLTTFSSYIPSAVFTLMVVMKECFETNELMQKLRGCVFEVLKPFADSAILTKELIMETGGKTLLFPGDTSWMTVFVTYRRLVEISAFVHMVCDRHKIPTLAPALLGHIVEVVRLLQKFHDMTMMLQQDDRPTISHVLPAVLELHEHLTACEGTMCAEISLMSAALRESLKNRFSGVFRSGENGSDPIYILSTFLDRNTAFLLTSFRKSTAVNVAKKMIRRTNALDIADSLCDEEIATTAEPNKTFSDSPYSSLISFAISMHEEELLNSACDSTTEVENYANTYTTWPVGNDFFSGIEFWRREKHRFPNMYMLASKCLCIPAGSSNVLQVLSQFGILFNRSNELNTLVELLKERVMLTFNRNFIRL